MIIRLTILLFFLTGFLTNGTSQKLSNQSVVSLLTCAPGDDIYTVYGHNAIRVRDPKLGLDKVYNYGTFDFDEPNFMLKFLRGKLRYQLASNSFRRFMAAYNRAERGITESRFSLDTIQRQYFYELLEDNLKPENRWYMYDFFYDNCATRIRDITEKVIGKNLHYPKKTEELTLRNMLDKYTYRSQWLTFGQSLIVGANADLKADLRQQMFIPDYLNTHLKNTTFKTVDDERPLIIQEKTLMHFDNNYSVTVITPVMIFLLILVWELFLLLKKKQGKWVRRYDKLIYFILALASILILVMWFLTDHGATKNNWNALWINPLFIWLLFISKSNKYFKYISNALIGFIIIALFYKFLPQDFYPGTSILIVAILLNLLRNRRTNIQSD